MQLIKASQWTNERYFCELEAIGCGAARVTERNNTPVEIVMH